MVQPTNNAQEAGGVAQQAAPHRWLRRCVVVLLVGACLVALNAALTYALLPYGGQTEAIWHQYYAKKDEPIDTLVVGGSYAMQDFVPSVIDERLGSHTYNLATPSQSRVSTLTAIRDAYEDHGISRVFIGTSADNMWGMLKEIKYDTTFFLAEAQGRSLMRSIPTYASMVTQPRFFGDANSFAAIMPWLANHVSYNRSAIQENLQLKATLTPEEALSANGLQMDAQGFIPQYGVYSGNDSADRATVAGDEEYQMSDLTKQEYRAICRYCKQHGIKLYFVVAPRPDFATVRFEKEGGYAVSLAQYEQLAREEGAEVIDFSLTKPEFYRAAEWEFHDVSHLNYDAAVRFSGVLADTIARMEAGEDLSGNFYPHTVEGWQEYLSTIDSLSLVTFYPTVNETAIDLEIKAFAGPSVAVEYQVSRVLADDSLEVLRPYSTETTFSYPIEGHGGVTLRVDARKVGAGAAEQPERYCVRWISY